MDLMELAEQNELLDHDLIIDVRGSSGGSFGAYAIQRLVSRPFRTTFGNVRISDAGAALIESFQNLEADEDAPDIFGLNLSRSWLIDWARTDAAEAIRRGGAYTPPTPFKLAHLPRDSGGVLEPAPVHFRGRTAIMGGPHGGSHLDQFLAMFADNDLAVVVGMPTGGYSNTWEHEEVLYFPGTDRPVAEFMWNIGHTLRPNTEILEGNPVIPDVPLPLTRENFRTYDRELLRTGDRSHPEPVTQMPDRLRSLDAFRGLTIAGMILVNNPGSWDHVLPALRHAEWHGWTPTDLIFPFFLFIVGVAIPFSLGRRIEDGAARGALLLRVTRRSAILIGLGLFMAAWPFVQLVGDFGSLRLPGVLQRIGVVYLAAGAAFLWLGRRGSGRRLPPRA